VIKQEGIVKHAVSPSCSRLHADFMPEWSMRYLAS
jgi:hypothetical protein